MSTKASDMAFPVNYIQFGLTKREYFAAMAMQGICSLYARSMAASVTAEDAVHYADALIAELSKVKP